MPKNDELLPAYPNRVVQYTDPSRVTEHKLIGSGPGLRAKVYDTTAQSTNSGVATTLTWNSETYDVGGLHDLVTNTSRLTIPEGGNVGVWVFTAAVGWASNATGYRRIDLYKNGGLAARIDQPANSGIPTFQQIVYVEDAPAVGDYFEAVVTQTSGGALTVGATGSTLTFFAATHIP